MTETAQNASTITEESEGSLLDQILSETKLAPQDDAYGVAKAGVQAFIAEMLLTSGKDAKIDKSAIDAMIVEIDQKLSKQINEVLHNEEVQKIESAWRSLKYTIDHVDFRENVRVEMLSVKKDELIEDFEDSPEIVKSGLYKTAYSNEYGVFGGQPYGAICCDYDFDPLPQDMELLGNCAAIAAMAHAPFIANAGPKFFGVNGFEDMGKVKDLKSLLEGPQYAKWHSFRESADANYVGLCMPRFLLRLPYGPTTTPVKSFNFEEDVVGNHKSYLWGKASVPFVTRIADSFAKYRWCPNIIGPQSGGTVEDLPLHQYQAMGELQTKIPTEVMLTERREFELADEGFIGLTYRKDSDNACFFSANSCQKPKFFGNTEEGKTAETNFRLGTQLPYMFVITRLAHYLKVMQREQLGSWKDRGDLQRELNQWIGQYVSDMEAPSPAVRSRRPLRKAAISVDDVEGQPGWFRCAMQVQPHLKYMGASFSLSLVGKLDK